MFAKSIILCVSALAAFVAAQSNSLAINNAIGNVQAGSTVTLSIKSQPGPYSIFLKKGDPNNLQPVSTITTSGSGDSFTWKVDSGLPMENDYALVITQADQTNYSPLFTIAGGSPSSSSSMASYGSASSSAPSTMSTAARSGTVSAMNCAVTQIKDGQPQAPTSCYSSLSPVATPMSTPKAASNSTVSASSSAAGASSSAAAPYVPLAGATGSPQAASNSTVPTYSVPSTPTSGSSSGSGSNSAASKAPKPTSGAAQIGSSFALIAGAFVAFTFLN